MTPRATRSISLSSTPTLASSTRQQARNASAETTVHAEVHTRSVASSATRKRNSLLVADAHPPTGSQPKIDKVVGNGSPNTRRVGRLKSPPKGDSDVRKSSGVEHNDEILSNRDKTEKQHVVKARGRPLRSKKPRPNLARQNEDAPQTDMVLINAASSTPEGVGIRDTL